jgi:hypothetical protein
MLLAIIQVVAAQDPLPTEPPLDPTPVVPPSAPSTRKGIRPPSERPVALGVGAFFNAGGSFMTQPQDRSYPGFAGEIPFSGWAGFSPGGGLAVDFRVKDAIGLELDVFRSNDHSQSKYGINGVDVFLAVDQPAWHIPILLKVGVPSDRVSPVLFFGYEMVLPGDPTLPQPAGLPWGVTAKASNYDLWILGLGVEAKLPIDGVDLRVPFNLRGSINTPYPTVATQRATYDVDQAGILHSMEYDLQWQYHAGITLGLTWYPL